MAVVEHTFVAAIEHHGRMAVVSMAAHGVAVFAHHRGLVLVGVGLTCQQRQQGPALHAGRHLQTAGGHQSWRHVNGFHQGIAAKPASELPRPGHDERYPHQAVKKAAALENQAVVTQHLAVVAHVDHDGVLKLPRVAQGLHDATKLVVNLFNHGVVVGLDLQRVVVVVGRRNGVMPVGRHRHDGLAHARVLGLLGLLVNHRKRTLAFDVGGPESRQRHVRSAVALQVLGRSIKGAMRIKRVDADHPGPVTTLGDESHRHL